MPLMDKNYGLHLTKGFSYQKMYCKIVTACAHNVAFQSLSYISTYNGTHFELDPNKPNIPISFRWLWLLLWYLADRSFLLGQSLQAFFDRQEFGMSERVVQGMVMPRHSSTELNTLNYKTLVQSCFRPAFKLLISIGVERDVNPEASLTYIRYVQELDTSTHCLP